MKQRKLYEQFNYRKENQRNDIKDWLILIAMLLLFGLAGGLEAKASELTMDSFCNVANELNKDNTSYEVDCYEACVLYTQSIDYCDGLEKQLEQDYLDNIDQINAYYDLLNK